MFAGAGPARRRQVPSRIRSSVGSSRAKCARSRARSPSAGVHPPEPIRGCRRPGRRGGSPSDPGSGGKKCRLQPLSRRRRRARFDGYSGEVSRGDPKATPEYIFVGWHWSNKTGVGTRPGPRAAMRSFGGSDNLGSISCSFPRPASPPKRRLERGIGRAGTPSLVSRGVYVMQRLQENRSRGRWGRRGRCLTRSTTPNVKM